MEKTISQKEKEVIIARLEAISPDLFFSVGSGNKSFSKKDLIEEINKNTEIGKDFVKSQFEFLRALKNGSLMNVLTAQ
ncbi:MAG: hypothetical protein Q8O89_04100 [Nanoarchaeota archaeon]|nr:hypothetical protein [Nanoarchaeota archaeon]